MIRQKRRAVRLGGISAEDALEKVDQAYERSLADIAFLGKKMASSRAALSMD